MRHKSLGKIFIGCFEVEISPDFGTCSVAYQLGAGHAVLNCCVFVGSDSVFLITSENCDFELCCILVCLTCFDVLADWADVRHQALQTFDATP